MLQQPPPPPPLIRSRLKQYKNLAIVTLAIVIAVVILVSPIFPIRSEYTVPETRTINLAYSSEVYGNVLSVPTYVNVTNKDSMGGNFSVTMNEFRGTFLNLQWSYDLDATVTQSQYIAAGATCKYKLPSNWYISARFGKSTIEFVE